ncbi:CCR4-NOT transcription complex subunit 1 [Hypsibius exemplaris]|uniref:CCR4-NOT transcription complex subunit 1 n=1 Tax=Hypsibius exemplaris TaxID=2072580 RepID=A0A1W0WL70_HYPEX|nr:CCR4-NOT transcription complex subunit 1 [Hypsibius exemplaris]
MQQLEMPKLYSLIVKETVSNIKGLLRTEKSADKYNDRTLLKNLGAWLGFMTIAMNRPVRARDIDMKALIVEAYHKGVNELYYAIPLVTKILCLSAKSKLFGKNNPWIRTILSLLGAVHSEPETKLNLKFEVEVLAKTLDIDVSDLGESPLLKNEDYVRWVMQFSQQLYGAPARGRTKQPSGPPDGQRPGVLGEQAPSQQHQQPPQGGAPPSTVPQLPPTLQTGPLLVSSGFRFHYKELHPPQFQSTFTRIHFNRDVDLFRVTDMSIRGALRVAVEKTLQEFLMPCVDRCMRIAVPAALVIARKDFSLDADPERVRSAGIVMVRHLASGLSFATMREHLYNALIAGAKTQILSVVRTATEEQQAIVAKACEVFAKDNLELCSAFLQKAAAERCIMEIEKTLQEEVKRRSEAKAEGKIWYDEEEAKFQRERIPTSLRLEPGGEIREQQLTVYEHFATSIPGFMTDQEYIAQQNHMKLQQRLMQQQQQLNQPQQQQVPGQKMPMQDVKEEDFIILCDNTVNKLTGHVAIMSNLIPNASDNRHLQLTIGLKNKIEQSRGLIRGGGSRAVVTDIVNFIVDSLLDGFSPEVLQTALNQQSTELHSLPVQDIVVRFKDACLGVLASFQDPKMFGGAVARIVSQFLVDGTGSGAAAGTFPHVKPASFEAFNLLIRAKMMVVSYLDQHLSKMIDAGNRDAIGLAQMLIRMFCVEDKMSGACGESDLFFAIEAMFRFCTRHNDVPFSVHFLMDEVKVDLSAGRRYDQRREAALENPMLAAHMHNAIIQIRDVPENHLIREKAENILRDWYTMVNGPHFGPAMHAIEKSSEAMPQAMDLVRTAFQRVFHELRNFLSLDDVATKFFKTCIEICARDCYRMVIDQPPANAALAQDQMRLKMAPMLDALARLFVLIVRFASETASGVKVPWLKDPAIATSKLLGIMAGVMFSHQEHFDVQFLAYPFHRIVYSFFMDLFIAEFKFTQIQEQIMLGFCNFFHAVRPQRLPGFTASWLELVYHRDVIRRINEIPDKRGWEMFIQLIVDSVKFVAPFVRNLQLNRALSIVFRALLRFLYTLLHDYPEVLAEYYCVLVDVIPINCYNMRNVVLSAAPLTIANDDPYLATFKIEEQKGIDFLPPRIVTRYHMFLQPISFRNDLDSYLNSRAPVTFLADLSGRLEMTRSPGQRYHTQMLNALVLYLGQQAVQALTTKGIQINSTSVAHSSHMDIIQNLAINFDNEGRFLLVNALVSHLRYPNIHTHYYYCVILHLFRDMSNHQHLQELIVRVLLERITSHRPHPWGLVATCSQVIRGPEYEFFEKDFVRFNDDLYRLPIFKLLLDGLPADKKLMIENVDKRTGGAGDSASGNDVDAIEADMARASIGQGSWKTSTGVDDDGEM